MNRDMEHVVLKIVNRIKEVYTPEKIILFGSFAYGNPDEESDIDLLIVKDTTERPIDRRVAVREIVADSIRFIPFQPIVITPGELNQRLNIGDQFLEEILSKGKVLYDRT